ncbi:hypothetical protein HYW75_04915 [Candidatus Pacearchaeota archaeon]|nr:hypothetical protein [Candidatus Pacearchaeota archaeon]
MSDYHGHYHGDIPFMIWILIVAIVCIGIGLLVPQLSVLLFIGIVLFIIWLGIIIIAFLRDISQ